MAVCCCYSPGNKLDGSTCDEGDDDGGIMITPAEADSRSTEALRKPMISTHGGAAYLRPVLLKALATIPGLLPRVTGVPYAFNERAIFSTV